MTDLIVDGGTGYSELLARIHPAEVEEGEAVESTQQLSDRVVELELRWMQLQRDFETLNAVVIEQNRELELMRTVLGRFENRLEDLTNPEPPRDPLAERPPHY